MKKQKKRLLSLLMAIVMVCSLLPTMAFAEGAGTCTLVTDASTLAAGDQIVIAAKANEKVYAAGALSGKFLASVETSLTDVGSDVAVFTLGGDASGWTLTSNKGKLCTSAAKAVNYSGTGTETWTISIDAEGKATIASTDSACGRILYNVNSPRFLNYTSNTSASMLLPSIYKVDDAGVTPDPDPAPVPTTVTIAEALAGESDAEFTVKGVVTLVDDKNIYIQDATGGIDLYFSAAPTDIALGDTVIGTGKKTEYNGLPELTSATYEKSEGLELTAKATTIDALTAADICTYVKLSGVEVTEVYDKDGAYTSPNITVSDGTNTIQLYKAVVGKTDGENWDIQVGDIVDITAAVGVYKTTTLQLRNTLASEITKAAPAPTGPLADGDKVVIYNPANLKALSTTYTGFYNNGTDVTVADGAVSGFTAADVWTVGVNPDGTYTFSTSEGKKLSMGASYTSTPLDDVNSDWEVIEAATAGCYYIKNAVRGSYLEWYASKGNWSSYTTISD